MNMRSTEEESGTMVSRISVAHGLEAEGRNHGVPKAEGVNQAALVLPRRRGGINGGGGPLWKLLSPPVPRPPALAVDPTSGPHLRCGRPSSNGLEELVLPPHLLWANWHASPPATAAAPGELD
jgi:hypothetical protein